MASMEDLIATMSGVHAGQQGNDLKDLHAKLQQTIPTQPYYRPIPPASSSSTIPPHSNTGPLPPPAPASSWNTPNMMSNRDASGLSGLNFGNFGGSPGRNGAVGTSPLRQGGWMSSSPSQPISGQVGKNGGVPGPKAVSNGGGKRRTEDEGDRPYHASVLPVRASPKETGGFEQDAFKPLWSGGGQPVAAQVGQGGGTSDWGGFTGERL